MESNNKMQKYLEDLEHDLKNFVRAARPVYQKEWWDIFYMVNEPGKKTEKFDYPAGTAVDAARLGNLRALMSFDDIPTGATEAAAAGGDLECLKFAHNKSEGWGFFTTVLAAYNDHVDCLQWALENGCALHPWTLRAAKAGSSSKCLKFLENL
jgi:hypothetical protein